MGFPADDKILEYGDAAPEVAVVPAAETPKVPEEAPQGEAVAEPDKNEE